MLKQRLIFGTLMTIFFTAVVVFDGWLDGSLMPSLPNARVQGTLLCLLVAALVIAAELELAALLEKTAARIFRPITISSALLLVLGWYLQRIIVDGFEFYLYVLLVLVFSLLGVFLYQAIRFGTSGVIANCGANFFSIFYIGLLGSFVLGVRIEFGVPALLMFVYVVKSADIGAYVAGKLFGAHKFSPVISPGKTWEGMAGAVLLAAIVASIFARVSGIMTVWLAVLFGAIFAFVGQLGDLAESMIKRGAQEKDSADNVPGFGGILDVIDSPLVAAPFAYLFFKAAQAG